MIEEDIVHKVRVAYACIDMLLTKQDHSLTFRKSKDKIKNMDDVVEFLEFGQEYYLSDGGYSRVCFSPDEKHLFLTDNSLNQAKELWEDEFVKEVLRKTQLYLCELHNRMLILLGEGKNENN